MPAGIHPEKLLAAECLQKQGSGAGRCVMRKAREMVDAARVTGRGVKVEFHRGP